MCVDLDYKYLVQRELLNKILSASKASKTIEIGDLITNDVAKFVRLYRLLMAFSDNATMFETASLKTSNMLTPAQQAVMSNYTGCVGGARFEAYACEHKDYEDYYSPSGICNNRINPFWGASTEPFYRLIPAKYDDGFVKPLGWFDRINSRLPNSRKVTEELLSTEIVTNDDRHNHLLMQFGQFLDHDLTFAALSDNRNLLEEDKIDCERLCGHNVEPCYSISYTNESEKCIEFKRSAEYCGTGFTSVFHGRLIRREQTNMITSFIDGSQIYGSTDELLKFLQSSSVEIDGELNHTMFDGRQYLPINHQNLPVDCQLSPYHQTECFLAGDHRANEQLGLLVFHNLWLRYHNYLARKLRLLLRKEKSYFILFFSRLQIIKI